MLASLLASLIVAPTSITLSRGAEIGQGIRYWAVEDTLLDASAQDRNYGRDKLLSAGPGRMVLVRFGDLERVIGPRRRVVDAQLRFTTIIGRDPQLSRIGRMTQPWGEGPGRRGFVSERASPPAGQGPEWSATWRHRRAGGSPIGWQRPGADGPNDLSPIEGARAVQDGDEWVVQGLGPAVQAMADRWYENHGFGIQLRGPVDFASSDADAERPRLIMTVEDVVAPQGPDLAVVRLAPTSAERVNGPETWTGAIRNVGDAPAAGFTIEWRQHERGVTTERVAATLGPGEETTVTLRGSAPRPDPRVNPLLLRIRPGGPDARPQNDALEALEGAYPLRLQASASDAERLGQVFGLDRDSAAHALVRFFNETILAQSRFSFAPEGPLERVRLHEIVWDTSEGQARDLAVWAREAMAQLGLPNYRDMRWDGDDTVVAGQPILRRTFDRFPGLMGGGDTRDESDLLGTLDPDYEPWFNPALARVRLAPTDLLSATDVALLQTWLRGPGPERGTWGPATPKTNFVRANTPWGAPLAGVELEFFPAADGQIPPAPAFRVTTSARGVATLPQSLDGANRLMLVRATRFGVTEYGWIKAWQAVDSKARSGFDIAFLTLTLPLPEQRVVRDTNLALERLVTNSAGTPPTRLAALVDGNADTAVALEVGANAWIEIDLGRDRALGEVRLSVLEGGLWPQFDLMIYGTGEQPSEARAWARERDAAWTLLARREPDAAFPGSTTIVYRGFASRARYLRLVPSVAAPGAVRLAEVRVYPLVVD